MRSANLRRRRRYRGAEREEASPMESVANLIDVMLVFICGLIIAIIVFWNIDLENLDQRTDSSYEDVGQVYQDPETGKIYVIQQTPSDETSGTEGTGAAEGTGGNTQGTGDASAGASSGGSQTSSSGAAGE